MASSSTAYTAGGTVKHKLGKSIVEDYKTVLIGQSTYFTGALRLLHAQRDIQESSTRGKGVSGAFSSAWAQMPPANQETVGGPGFNLF